MSASTDIQAKYLGCYEDPLTTSVFPRDCYPAERDDNGPAPDNVKEAKARFKAVYARRNACLLDLSRLQPGDPNRLTLVQQVIFFTEAIDHLEDVYSPIGFIAEPVMDDTMVTSELIFTHARIARSSGEPSESSFCLYIPIPLGNPEQKEGPNAA